MPGGPSHKLLWHLHGLVQAGSADGPADESLLGRFVAHKDEAAFAALVHRHGPTVWGVCRRMLSRVPDAEDAFQAVFLVLARKAGSIRKPSSLDSWLHGVACRVARKARAAAARRAALPALSAPVVQGPEIEVSWREVRAVLDEELDRLPDKYKAPLLLCCLEGLTRDEAAARLGLSPGVLRGRLERGRLRLRARLARRGFALSAGLFGAALASPARAVPAPLAVAAVQAAAGKAFSPPQVVALCEGVLRAMFLNNIKIKIAAVVVILLALAGLTVGLASGPLSAQDPQPKPPATGPAAKGVPASDLEQRVAELEKRVLQLTREVEDLRGAKKKELPEVPSGEGHTVVLALKHSLALEAARVVKEVFGADGRRMTVAVDERTNSLIVRATPADLETLRRLLENVDKPSKAAETSDAQLVVFPLKSVAAEEVVRLLEKVYQDKKLRASSVGGKSVAVYGTPQELKEVGQLIEQLEQSLPKINEKDPAKP